MLSNQTPTRAQKRLAIALGELLPELEARLQRLNLQRLAPILSGFFPPRYKAASPVPETDVLLNSLAKTVRHLEAEREDIVQKLEQASAAGLESPDSVGRRQAFRVWLAERGGRLGGWATRRRAKRYLDLDALKARYQRERLRCDLLMEVCFKLLKGATERALRSGPALGEDTPAEMRQDWSAQALVDGPSPAALQRLSLHWLKSLGLEGFLTTRCTTGRPATRILALQILTTLAEPLPEAQRVETLGSQTLRTLFRCLEPREDKQVQLAAAGLLAVTSREELRELLTQRLLMPAKVKDDFVVRRGLLRLLAQRFNDASGLRILELLVAERDPSEGVRMAMVEALGRFPGKEAARLLYSMEPGKTYAEAAPRVRACLALSWERWLQDLARQDVGYALSIPAKEAQQALLRLLITDPAELVRQTALEALMGVLTRALTVAYERTTTLGELSEAQLEASLVEIHRLSEALLHTLQRKNREPGLSPAERTRCAEAQEQLYILLDPARLRLSLTLKEKVSRLGLGQSCRISAKVVPDAVTLGRVLAQLSREDFGLYATRLSGTRGYRITRGEHFVRRAWRILHELRHRAPNKRQGFVHTTGRHFAGELRAHPGALAEITATTVPGERLLSEAEGSWGRYLPLVDDLLCTALLRRTPVHLFSAEGVTEIIPPATLRGRLLARAELSRQYESLSHLRRLALSSPEPEEQQLYVRKLRDELGFQVKFEPHAGIGPRVRGSSPNAMQTAFYSPVRDQPHPTLQRVFAAAAAVTPPDPERLTSAWKAIVADLMVRLTGSIGHLALMVLILLGYSVVRGVVKMGQVRKARAHIPLVVGGWGTRGKSGTERLKAALFQGMGYEVLVKTTGCEAMVIHALPDSPAMELFLYRPYDKATIWEQFDCIRLAARLDVQVFLYECMALQPRYVSVIQNDWSRDDVSTLTNAYPDHEDIQGPSGVDVAWCISAFIREGGRVFTTEEQMLPVLKEAARRKDATLTSVSLRTSDLIPQDFLDRFPYQEHPRNIALVLSLGQSLGFEPDRALMEMADRVVPDIGVLKAYPKVEAYGRQLQFVSGNSANERTGFMSNWRRMGFGDYSPQEKPGDWVVTVVNNRMDRVSRSQVFAEILVRDVSAHRHVLIGTNIAGLVQYLQQSLDKYVQELTLLQPEDEAALRQGGLDLDTEARRLSRFDKYVAHLKLPGLDGQAVMNELLAWLNGLGLSAQARTKLSTGALTAQLQHWLDTRAAETAGASATSSEAATGTGTTRTPAPGATTLADELAWFGQAPVRGYLEAALEAVFLPVPTLVSRDGSAATGGGLGSTSGGAASGPSPITLAPEVLREELVRFVVRSMARVRRMCYVKEVLLQGMKGASSLEVVNETFRNVYREFFLETLVPLHDATLSGDAVIRACAGVCPPGSSVHLMGTQNIKGTGLDFVYRWASIGTIDRYLSGLNETKRTRLIQTLTLLREHPDYGLIDACQALEVVEALRHSGSGAFMTLSEELHATVTHLKAVVETRRQKLLKSGGEGMATGTEAATLASRGGEVVETDASDPDEPGLMIAARAFLDRCSRTLDGLGLTGVGLGSLEQVLEPLESVRRRDRARLISEALVEGLVSHERAAAELRRLNKEQKGGWLSAALKQGLAGGASSDDETSGGT